MKNNKSRNNRIKLMSPQLMVVLVIITTSIVLIFSLSKYKSTVASENSAKVAAFVLELQSDSILDIPIEPIAPNSKQEILFEVSNQKDQKQSEITMQYTVEISSMANLPLSFKLYRYNESTKQYEQVKLTANTTDQIKYGFSEQVNHKYKLEINWNTNAENYNSYEYSKTIDKIKIAVNAIQVD